MTTTMTTMIVCILVTTDLGFPSSAEIVAAGWKSYSRKRMDNEREYPGFAGGRGHKVSGFLAELSGDGDGEMIRWNSYIAKYSRRLKSSTCQQIETTIFVPDLYFR